MKEPLWIGIDIGTTGVRAVAYQPDGRSLGAATREYPLNSPHAGWAEQDPEEILLAMLNVLSELTGALTRSGSPAGRLGDQFRFPLVLGL